MSYCRWSSDNFRCELYCYEGADGDYTTHVAYKKHVGQDRPEVIPLTRDSAADGTFIESHHKLRDWLETAKLVKIELPHAGETFHDPGLEFFLARLLWLKSLGYRFPESVIETVRAELEEAKKTSE